MQRAFQNDFYQNGVAYKQNILSKCQKEIIL